MDKDSVVDAAVSIIRKHLPDEYGIVLFGSWAKGNADERSDIDIGILGDIDVPWEIMSRILRDVDAIRTLRSIDIVDLRTVDQSFRTNVLKSAKTLDG